MILDKDLDSLLVEELVFSFDCESRWLNAVVRILDYVGLTNVPSMSNQIHWQEFAVLSSSGRRVSWSRFHRRMYRYWNNWLIFWLRVKYWVKLGAWF